MESALNRETRAQFRVSALWSSDRVLSSMKTRSHRKATWSRLPANQPYDSKAIQCDILYIYYFLVDLLILRNLVLGLIGSFGSCSLIQRGALLADKVGDFPEQANRRQADVEVGGLLAVTAQSREQECQTACDKVNSGC